MVAADEKDEFFSQFLLHSFHSTWGTLKSFPPPPRISFSKTIKIKNMDSQGFRPMFINLTLSGIDCFPISPAFVNSCNRTTKSICN